MSSQAFMNSKTNKCSGYNPGNLDMSIREPKCSEAFGYATLTRLITMRASSIPSCLMTRDRTYSRATTDIAATMSKTMTVVANAGPVLRSPPAGGLSREAIAEFFGKEEECMRR